MLHSAPLHVPGRRLFVLLYAASGAAALVYEVTWTRLLTLQLGHTVAAASTVLAAFMGGLALGAWIAGAVRRHERVGLRAYAILELLVAVCALLLPVALAASVPALAWAYADGGAPARFAVVRVAISLALLGIPAAAMGATFPIAAGWFARDAADTGVLYAVNTAGAALGAIAAGLLPDSRDRPARHDLDRRRAEPDRRRRRLVAGVAITTRRNRGDRKDRGDFFFEEQEEQEQILRRLRGLSGLRGFIRSCLPRRCSRARAAAISGFAALVYEVAWTRLLALVIGPTTYAFATMAAAFISGLAIGSALGTRLARRVERPAVWLAAMLVVSAIAASGAAWLAATRMPLIVAAQVADPAAAFTPVIVTQAFGTALLLLPMTLALGATFPLALAAAAACAAPTLRRARAARHRRDARASTPPTPSARSPAR